MMRWLIALAVLGVVVVWSAFWFRGQALPPIRVGILHSKTGPMKISEESMIDAEVMAIEEINQQEDCWVAVRSSMRLPTAVGLPTFAHEAQRLIELKEVNSDLRLLDPARLARASSRLGAEPAPARLSDGARAWKSLQYHLHGCGTSPCVSTFCLSWCYQHLKARKYYLIGSDYVWPHCVNEIAKDQLKALGAECVGESYILFGSSDVSASVESIRKANPDVIISTVVGDSNTAFYQRLQTAGILPEQTPVISFSIAEDELRNLPLSTIGRRLCGLGRFPVDRPEVKTKSSSSGFDTNTGPIG